MPMYFSLYFWLLRFMIPALMSLQYESYRDGILDSNLQLNKVIESCRDGISDSKHRPVHNQTLVKWGNAWVKYYLTVQTEKDRQVQRNIAYYSLEMILAIGYRVKSERGTQFRTKLSYWGQPEERNENYSSYSKISNNSSCSIVRHRL
jgi:hypothetical protein